MESSNIILYIVQHVHTINEDEDDIKFIGVYSSIEKAKSAVCRLKFMPGFRDNPETFSIDVYELDEDNWIEGFFNSSN
jgi:hypothetical protein